MEKIQAIDTMCRSMYCKPETWRGLLECSDLRTILITTFGGTLRQAGLLTPEDRTVDDVLNKLGLERGETWKLISFVGHSTVEEAIKEMDEVGVEKIFIAADKLWSWRESKLGIDVSIETISKMVEESNGRIVGGVSYNPLRIKESLQEIETAVRDYGFKYVWFHPVSFGIAPNDKKCYPLYAKCLELEIPVCYQSGQCAEPLPCENGRPYYADDVAIDFPDLTLVLTHTGWPWTTEWMSMLWRHPNVYGNIGAYFPSFLDPNLVHFMDTTGQDKIFWATNGYGLARSKSEFMELPVRDRVKKKVLRENAIRVFKL